MYTFTVNVENARCDAFVELLKVNNFTNATVQCSVFRQDGDEPLPPPGEPEEEEVEMKLFDTEGYIEDEMTRMTLQEMQKEEAKRREKAAARRRLEDLDAGVEVERPFQTRNSRMKTALPAKPVTRRRTLPAKPVTRRSRTLRPGEEETMEKFVILGTGGGRSRNKRSLRDTSGLRRSARLAVKQESISPSVSPVRERRVSVKTEVMTPPESPVPKRRLISQSESSTVDPRSIDSHSDDELLGGIDRKANPKNIKSPQMIVCSECGNSAKRSRPRQMYHVMTFHTEERSLKCPHCPFEGARQASVKLHMANIHGSHDAPIDIVTDEKRAIWDEMMKKCFPEFSDDTGFYKERVSTY